MYIYIYIYVKKTCGRQVVLDAWFPLTVAVMARARRLACGGRPSDVFWFVWFKCISLVCVVLLLVSLCFDVWSWSEVLLYS